LRLVGRWPIGYSRLTDDRTAFGPGFHNMKFVSRLDSRYRLRSERDGLHSRGASEVPELQTRYSGRLSLSRCEVLLYS